MTIASEGSLDSLKFRLEGSKGDIDSWGHEYVRFVFYFNLFYFIFNYNGN